LAKQDDPSEVIGIVGCQALQLFPDRHDADGIAWPRWAADGLFESLLVTCHVGSLLITE
jgi:hypothetical protein